MAPHTKVTFPGLAGLVLLIPVLCLFYLNDTGVTTPKCAIAVAMPLRDCDVINMDTLNSLITPFYKPLPRNYQNLNITGNEQHDDAELKKGKTLMRDLMALNDTINGIRFCLGKNAKYNELVKIITLCNEEKVYQWMLKDNYLYIYNNYKPLQEGTNTIEYIYL